MSMEPLEKKQEEEFTPLISDNDEDELLDNHITNDEDVDIPLCELQSISTMNYKQISKKSVQSWDEVKSIMQQSSTSSSQQSSSSNGFLSLLSQAEGMI